MFSEMLSNWRIWVVSILMFLGLYGFIWAASIACVAAGGSMRVCGL